MNGIPRTEEDESLGPKHDLDTEGLEGAEPMPVQPARSNRPQILSKILSPHALIIALALFMIWTAWQQNGKLSQLEQRITTAESKAQQVGQDLGEFNALVVQKMPKAFSQEIDRRSEAWQKTIAESIDMERSGIERRVEDVEQMISGFEQRITVLTTQVELLVELPARSVNAPAPTMAAP